MAESGSALIISSGEEFRESAALVAKEYGFGSISVSDGKEVRSVIENSSFDLIILNTPLADEFGLELASFIAHNTDAAVIIAAASKNCDSIDKKIGELGICVLPKPLNKPVLLSTIRFAMASRDKLSKLREENRKLEAKLHDQKQINRAKCALIQYLRISEEDAHRQIQKRAMDQRVPEVEVALDILRTYET